MGRDPRLRLVLGDGSFDPDRGRPAAPTRIRLATLATSVAFRNPAHLAKIAAGVDQISRGRLTLGIGAGWFEGEYKQYGWEFPAPPATGIRPAGGGGPR